MRRGISTCNLHDCRIHFNQADGVYIFQHVFQGVRLSARLKKSLRVGGNAALNSKPVCSQNSDLWFAYFIYDGIKTRIEI